MSENIPAFPTIHGYVDSFGSIRQKSDGMTLRDWFAGQALSGLLCNGYIPKGKYEQFGFDFAKGAYAMADDMIAARSVPPTDDEFGEK